jgi:hypothetical protein
MSDGEKLRERLDEIIRESAENQARAYHQCGGLLDRLACRDIRSAEFAREAVDLYMAAVAKATSSGAALLGESLLAGIKGVGLAASATADAARAAEREAAARETAEREATGPTASSAPDIGSAAPV